MDRRPQAGTTVLDVGGWRVVVTDGHTVLPDGMTHLPDDAFYGHRSALFSVVCPSSLVSIGDRAFYSNFYLTSITLPAGLTSIGESAFYYCCSLASISSVDSHALFTFPASLASIGRYAFYAGRIDFAPIMPGSSHTRVTVPATAQIGEEAFPYAATILRVPPASMRAQERLLFFYKGALAYKRCRPGLLGWLERAQIRLGAYGPDGAARQRDLEEFEGDCALAAIHA